jgi:hypothetical protein
MDEWEGDNDQFDDDWGAEVESLYESSIEPRMVKQVSSDTPLPTLSRRESRIASIDENIFDLVRYISDILCLNNDQALILLREYNWEKENIESKWFDGGEKEMS